MTPAAAASNRGSLLGLLVQILRTATLERMILQDADTSETDQRILLDSHLVRTSPQMFAHPRAPFL